MGCSRRDNWYCAHVAFIQFSNSTTPTARLVGAYVHALSRGGRLETAREVLEAHAHLGGDTAIARASLIAAVAKQYGADAAFNELLATPSHLWSPHACTSVMHAFGVEGVRPHVAVEILESARTRGVVVDRGMYDSAMRALGRAGKVKEAYLLLTSMIKDNISPSDITFEALIYACAHAQTENSNAMLGKRACVVFEAAKEANQVTPRVLSAFASVILRSGIWDDHRAVDLINRMGNVAKLDSEQLRKKGVKFELFESKLYRLRLLREKSLTIALDKSLDKQGHKAAKKQRLRVPNWTQPEKL